LGRRADDVPARPGTALTVDIDAWTSFSGKAIPKGNTIFWPPTRLTPEYARHGFDDGLMQRLWTHLANAGFEPVVLDCYSVAGNVFYNSVWRPANGSLRGYFGQTSGQLQDRADKAKADGLAPVFVESCSSKHTGRATQSSSRRLVAPSGCATASRPLNTMPRWT
jgi:hypothetical protein